jgi:hypothetical protein
MVRFPLRYTHSCNACSLGSSLIFHRRSSKLCMKPNHLAKLKLVVRHLSGRLPSKSYDLDLVAVRVSQERGAIVRIVLGSYARRSLIRPTIGKSDLIAGDHGLALPCVER